MVIGTQRGGANTFYRQLIQHPMAVPPHRNGTHFFDQNYSKGLEWYRRQFPLISLYNGSRPSGHVTGESSPYYMYHPLVAERVKLHCPKAKFIVLLRNPAERAYSHYRFAVDAGQETLPFLDALRIEAKRLERGRLNLLDNPFHTTTSGVYHSYVSHGFYANQLRTWFRHFDRDQFLIVRSEDYFADPLPHILKAQSFLGLSQMSMISPPESHPRFYDNLTEATRKTIEKIFDRSNDDLCRMLGWSSAW